MTAGNIEALAWGAFVIGLCAAVLALVALALSWDARRRAQAAEDAVRLLVHQHAEPDAEPTPDPEPEPEAAWQLPVLRLVEAPPPSPQAQVAVMLEALASRPEGEAHLTDTVLHALSTEEHLAMNAAVMEVARTKGRNVSAEDDPLHGWLHLRWSTPTP